jgi:hypothetical protein
MELSSER